MLFGWLGLLELDQILHGRNPEYLNNILLETILRMRAHHLGRLVAHTIPTAQLHALGHETIALYDMHGFGVLFLQIAHKLLVTHGQRVKESLERHGRASRASAFRLVHE